MNILLTLRFDGSAYCGFQVQKNGRSVCAVIQDGLQAVLGFRLDVKGCSRTDAGVHALAYRLNFHAETKIPMEKLPLALNAHLPADVRVTDARQVAEDFHARYAAHEKTYLYRLRPSMVDDPFTAKYTYRVHPGLDVAAMQVAAQQLQGTHDFLSLCSAGSSVAAHGDTVRTISRCTVLPEGEELHIRVTADGYLYNMVRILAGTLLDVGRHKLRPEDIPGILEAKDRGKAGSTLPPQALFLENVEYEQA